jgi:hypothetical protein
MTSPNLPQPSLKKLAEAANKWLVPALQVQSVKATDSKKGA